MTQEILEQVEQYKQTHILKFFNELSDEEKSGLIRQIERIDFSKILKPDDNANAKDRAISPINVLDTEAIQESYAAFAQIGMEALKSGSVGLVLLAGGQGSRLGFQQSKGMFNIGISKKVYLFQILLDNVRKIVESVGNWLYIFIMTSPQNNEQIIQFFEENDYFDYNKEYVKFYIQSSLPSINFDGKLLMKSKSELCFSPDGNGSFFYTLKNTPLWNIIKNCGIKWLNVFSIDNVLQKMADPVFIGATIGSNCNCGAKVVKKKCPQEKIGVICLKNKAPAVIEYYELSDKLNAATDTNTPYNYGVILNYLFKIDALEKIPQDMLPLHYAKKHINCIDENGIPDTSGQLNAYKLEYLITDLIEYMKTCLPFEVVREREFAPLKNRVGVDSIDSARKMLLQNGYDL